MVNITVDYMRSCRSLITLQSEIRAWRPGREQNLGFITGYPELARTGMLSGHYPDHNGITFGYDIGVDIQGDGTGLLPADAELLAEYLTEKCHPRFQYLIYDEEIEGNHTGWRGVPYYGVPHKNHIHISVVDVEYGESSGISSEVFDSTEPWGIVEALGGGLQSGGVKPIKRPKPKPDGAQYVTLPAGVESWAIYKLGVEPVKGNQFNGINTARYGQLTYEVKGWSQEHVAIIETAQLGRVQIYVAPGTKAKITGDIPARRPQPAPKPEPKPAPVLASPTGLFVYLPSDVNSWNIYRPGAVPRDGNQALVLNPAANPWQRKYPFLEWVTPSTVALMSTDMGPMQIYLTAATRGYVGR